MASRKANRERILALLQTGDKCQSDIVNELHLGLSTVSRWVEDILKLNQAYVRRYKVPPNGGPLIAFYRAGAAPEGFKPWRPKAKTDRDRTRTSRKARRKNGEWDDVLARQRAAYWKDKPAKRDALTAAFFGVVEP